MPSTGMPSSNNRGSHFGAILGVHAGRPAREDQPLRRELAHPVGRDVVPHDLAIHVLLADPSGDQLHVLRAEVEHEHSLVGDEWRGRHGSASDRRGKRSIIGLGQQGH